MEICYESAAEPSEPATPAEPGAWRELFETVESEWVAFGEALSAPGRDPVRKWLGWALYRMAARLNPEIDERDR